MKNSLISLSQIFTGVYCKTTIDGDLVYLQTRNFDEKGNLEMELYKDILTDEINKKHLLKEGDVLFAAKGEKNFATLYKNYGFPAVASTSFFVIRLKDDRIEPEFLTWFLNQPNTMNYLKSRAAGSSIPSISKKVLENLEIPLLDKKKQYLIMKIDDLQKRKKEIRQQVDYLENQIIDQNLLDLLK